MQFGGDGNQTAEGASSHHGQCRSRSTAHRCASPKLEAHLKSTRCKEAACYMGPAGAVMGQTRFSAGTRGAAGKGTEFSVGPRCEPGEAVAWSVQRIADFSANCFWTSPAGADYGHAQK